jgi:glyoxylase-like metal-dependent hydrolase (beta-lactamase superfamily II)
MARMSQPSTARIDRIEGDAMAVNSFLVHGRRGVVVVDAQLTVPDAQKVHEAVRDTGLPLAGVVVTHPHPDHYAGAALIAAGGEPIFATPAVDAVIRRDDDQKDRIVGGMMGEAWPRERRFPDHTVEPGSTVEVGGLMFAVTEVGPGESHVDTMWSLSERDVFAGDIAYHGMHAYLADAHHEAWRSTLDRLERELPDDVVLHLGHGRRADRSVLATQRRYLDAFVDAVSECAELDPDDRHAKVADRMRALVPDQRLMFLLEVSIEPMHDALMSG